MRTARRNAHVEPRLSWHIREPVSNVLGRELLVTRAWGLAESFDVTEPRPISRWWRVTYAGDSRYLRREFLLVIAGTGSFRAKPDS